MWRILQTSIALAFCSLPVRAEETVYYCIERKGFTIFPDYKTWTHKNLKFVMKVTSKEVTFSNRIGPAGLESLPMHNFINSDHFFALQTGNRYDVIAFRAPVFFLQSIQSGLTAPPYYTHTAAAHCEKF
jgi:hypothetical protein